MANLPNAGIYDVRGTSEVLTQDEKRQRGGESVTHTEHLFSSLVLIFSHGIFLSTWWQICDARGTSVCT
jgi:hypothetical protein